MQNCELRGTDHIQGRIYEHIFAQIIGYCIYHPSNILQHTQKEFYEQLSCFSAWNVFLIVLPTSVTITKRHSLILNWISIVDLRFENWVIWLGWYSRISVAPNANNCSVKVAEQNRERSSHHIACSKSTVSVSLAEIP